MVLVSFCVHFCVHYSHICMYYVCTGQFGCFGYTRIHNPAANTLLLGFDCAEELKHFTVQKTNKKQKTHTIKDHNNNVIFI